MNETMNTVDVLIDGFDVAACGSVGLPGRNLRMPLNNGALADQYDLRIAARRLSYAVRLLLSRTDPALAHTVAAELALVTTELVGTRDPVTNWDVPAQIDRRLGRARCLQRMVRQHQWRSGMVGDLAGGNREPAHATPTLTSDTAAYLFAAVMNLEGLTTLPAEAYVFRLWYLAAHATQPPGAAVRMFGDLKALPSHQQLAAGARTVDQLDQRTDEAARAASDQVSPPKGVTRGLGVPSVQALAWLVES